jgi:hypothetical protein
VLDACATTVRSKLRPELAGSHPRTPDAAAAMVTGLQTLSAYALSTGALEREAADEFLSMARAGFIEAAKAHAEATKGGDPATRFVEILRSLFNASRVYAKDRETGGHPDDWDDLGLYRRKRDEGLSNRTLSYIHTTLRRALKDAVGDDLIPRNPTDCVKPPETLQGMAKEPQALTLAR